MITALALPAAVTELKMSADMPAVDVGGDHRAADDFLAALGSGSSMRKETPTEPAERSRLRTMALSRWENEGGAGIEAPPLQRMLGDEPPLTQTELMHLRIRVIALENLVIALLAHVPDQQLALAREMAAYISPRPGFTPHPLTLRAAAEMLSLTDRAGHFRTPPTA